MSHRWCTTWFDVFSGSVCELDSYGIADSDPIGQWKIARLLCDLHQRCQAVKDATKVYADALPLEDMRIRGELRSKPAIIPGKVRSGRIPTLATDASKFIQ